MAKETMTAVTPSPFAPGERVKEERRIHETVRRAIAGALSEGVTGRYTLLKLTGGGVDGFLRFEKGILVEAQEPT